MARWRYNPCSFLPRRLQIVVTLALFILVSILIWGTPSSRQNAALDMIRTPVHAPPKQEGSSSGDVSWLSHRTWMHPFSAAVAIDDRAVLPPESRRPAVYTYYDPGLKQDKAEKAADHELLLTWRRAWWAKGFRPIILGKPEAMHNPHYRSLQSMDLTPELETDLMRWLAWGTMGIGILSDWMAFPMCNYNDPALRALRQGNFRQLTRFESLQNAFFYGNGKEINEAIRAAIGPGTSQTGMSILELVPKATFEVEPKDKMIAYYSPEVIQSKYKEIHAALKDNKGKGKVTLRRLIESHLQSTWQSSFTKGIAVLRPIPESLTAATSDAYHLAQNLSACLESPSPSSCPPNVPDCSTCMTSHPMPVTTPKNYMNDSTIFSIGVVPHPYTMVSLMRKHLLDSFKEIRRETKRDPYILAVTNQKLGGGISSYERIVFMKESVASDRGRAITLWMPAERPSDQAWREDLSWVLGFPIPTEAIDDGKSDGPLPGPEQRKKKEEEKEEFIPSKMPDEKGVKLEHTLLAGCKDFVHNNGKTKGNKRMNEVIEKWNMADAELWNFVRAFALRRRKEREIWDNEEKRFLGGEKRGVAGGWNNWFNT